VELHLDILDEEFRFGTHPDGGTEDLACGGDVEFSNLESGVGSPKLVEEVG
jgi:hypothetical protein